MAAAEATWCIWRANRPPSAPSCSAVTAAPSCGTVIAVPSGAWSWPGARQSRLGVELLDGDRGGVQPARPGRVEHRTGQQRQPDDQPGHGQVLEEEAPGGPGD